MTENEGLKSVETRVLSHVDQSWTIQTLCRLIQIPSVGGSAGEEEMQALLASQLTELGLAVDRWSIDLEALRAAPDFPGEEVTRNSASGLAAWYGQSGATPGLILQGHVDVVPPGQRELWSSDPFEPRRESEAIWGRGACDMKGGIAAILAALAAVRRANVTLTRPLAVHFAVAEEDGGLGAFAAVRRFASGEFCIIPEPTNLQIVGDTAGALSFRIIVSGLAAHASMRHLGISSIDSYLQLHRALHSLEARRNAVVEHVSMQHLKIPYAISIGKLRAGNWASTVPDRLVAEGRMGVKLGEDPMRARAELEEAIGSACARDRWLRHHPPTVEWIGGQFTSSHLSAESPLLESIALAHADANSAPRPTLIGAPYGSDMRLYHAAGIPTAHYGPGDPGVAHSPNEFVPISQVLQAARTLALLVVRLCRARSM